jgi:sugar O-acyltransferase (sialic acid O-acetyltransferase NeuD family)
MSKPIIIFGIGKIAEVVHYYAANECGFTVAAFCVDKVYITSETFAGLPVIPFENIEEQYSPETHDMFVAVGYHDLNNLRTTKCNEATGKGYHLVSIVSSTAQLPVNVVYGHNCFIMPPCIIHPNVKIGNNVFVWSGAMIAHHSVVEDNCWLTSSCSISGNVIIGENSFLAVNATVGHSVVIGKDCFLGANTLVTKNLEDGKVVIAESSKPIRLNSKQFLRISAFSNL